jgi:hypothetical protein
VVGVARGFAFAVLRTVIVPCLATAGVGDASAYFFVVGQIKRHGWVFIVSLNCLMFSPAGSRSVTASFSFSDELRRFRSVTSILSFSVRLVLIFSMLVSECESALSGEVRPERCSPNVLNWVRARFS